MNYDIAIIGGGPGGYVAALKAAKLGLKTALFEANELGGVCLNAGCIPTKTMIASANRMRMVKGGEKYGIKFTGEVKVDYKEVISRKNNVISQLVKGLHQLIKAHKIDYIKGYAKLNADRSISTGEDRYEAKNIIIATGSVWKEVTGILACAGMTNTFIMTGDDILKMEDIPQSLCILGGGVVGCEFASIFNAFGTKITIIEAMPSILPMEDDVTAKSIARSFGRQGIKIITNTTVKEINKKADAMEIILSSGEKIESDRMLVSIGRTPKIDGFGLENLGVRIEKNAVVTDEKMRTNVSNVYAIGDVNGKYMLAHVASEEGIVAVENIAGKDSKMNYDAVPRPVYTNPEVAAVGATEKELVKKGVKFMTGKSVFLANSKAICDGITEGQTIIYASAIDKKILGAQVVGEHATEITGEIGLAIRNGLTISQLIKTIHSHPTLSETIKEATEDCDGIAIHKVYR